MGKVSKLPLKLANQIAAGEVVERPASVVKELVENAIDAGGGRIVVGLEFGGKRLIRVQDDGEGMATLDAGLALERHATSKVSTLGDLESITTLGFRGEALPSIASVSHLKLRTRTADAESVVEISVDGGEVASVSEAGLPEGTTVEIRDLFFNVPARRKFLKSDGAETAQISKFLTQVALGHFAIGFTLISGRRTLLEHPPVASFTERFFQIYGDRRDLVKVERQAAGIRLFGLVAALAEQGPTRGPQHVFVNGRVVKDKTIAHAVTHAYSQATIKPRSPELHLFLEIPHDRVDVNVHPTKSEIRFLDQSLVHEIVRRALMDALGQEVTPTVAPESPYSDRFSPKLQQIPGVVAGLKVSNPWDGDDSGGRRSEPDGRGETDKSVDTERPVLPTDSVDSSDVGVSPLIPLGQFRDTFIVAVDNDGIVIIDQHVAHERILFEQVLAQFNEGTTETQRLLEPLVIDLPPECRSSLERHVDDLTRLGFDVQPFGGDSVCLASVPVFLPQSVCEGVVRALADDLDELESGAGAEDAVRRSAATTACHAAVKANDHLTLEKMTYLLEELRRTAYSTVCPHGRPVLLRLTRRQLEKSFDRI